MFLYFLQHRQLHPEQPSGGFASFDEITEEDDNNSGNEEKDDPKPGGALGDIDEPGGETDEEKTKREAAEQKAAADKKAADDAEAARLEAEKTKDKDKDKSKDESESEGDDEDEEDFWADVDKLRGETIDVDYGDVDPLTPEGALIRERAVEQYAIDKFEQHLEQSNPKAYAYLLHTMEGGTDEEFFNMTTGVDHLPTEEEIENDVDIQKKLVTEDLKAKGNSDKVIASAIKAMLEDDELEEAAKDALANKAKAATEKVEAVKAAAAQKTAERQSSLDKMGKYVSAVVNTGTVDNITIPEKDRKPFIEAFNKNVRYENGKFLLVQELSDDNIMNVFKKEFFNFKGGKVEDLITRAAKTENTVRLKKTLGSDKRVKAAPSSNDNNFVGLGGMED